MRLISRLLLLLLILASAGPALACPICHTGTGQQVRAGLFDGAFYFNLLSAASPFVVFGAVAALVHFRWRDE